MGFTSKMHPRLFPLIRFCKYSDLLYVLQYFHLFSNKKGCNESAVLQPTSISRYNFSSRTEES